MMADINSPTALPLGAVGSVSKWLQKPFNEGGSAVNWILFTGLILCAVFFWTRVLAHIRREI
jgi:hypothetical protein